MDEVWDDLTDEHWTGNPCPSCKRRTLIQATHVDQCDACGYGEVYHDYASS